MGKTAKKKIVKRPAKAVLAGVKPAKAKAAKPKLTKPKKKAATVAMHATAPLLAEGGVLDRLWAVVMSRRNASPSSSHSARLLSRGVAKVAQKFGEEAVEALIEAVAGNREALVAESADVLYHLIVLWVATGIAPEDVWAELRRREGVSGIAEKAARTLPVALRPNTRKIP
jgi:phosphoribosyl-ATP pyrophosphohydrolase